MSFNIYPENYNLLSGDLYDGNYYHKFIISTDESSDRLYLLINDYSSLSLGFKINDLNDLINKFYEWDSIAIKNNINDFNKKIKELKFVRSTKDFIINFYFVRKDSNDNSTSRLLMILPETESEQSLSLNFDISILKKIQKSIGSENIKKVISDANEKKKKIEELFK